MEVYGTPALLTVLAIGLSLGGDLDPPQSLRLPAMESDQSEGVVRSGRLGWSGLELSGRIDMVGRLVARAPRDPSALPDQLQIGAGLGV